MAAGTDEGAGAEFETPVRPSQMSARLTLAAAPRYALQADWDGKCLLGCAGSSKGSACMEAFAAVVVVEELVATSVNSCRRCTCITELCKQ